MHALVTGVAGFIGSRLAAALAASGHDVWGVDRFSDYYDLAVKQRNLAMLRQWPNVRLSRLDLCHLTPAHLAGDLDVVFHVAAQPGVRGSWGDAFGVYVQDNVLATQRLLECVARQPTPPRFVYSSSSSIYGAAEAYPTPSTARPRPRSPYGVTKLTGESLVEAYAMGRGVAATSLRYFSVYGPGQRPDMAIHRIIDAALTGRPFVVLGDGHQVRDYTYVDDVVAANLLAASCPETGYAALNVAGGAEISLLGVIELVEDTVGARVALEWAAADVGDPPRTCGDTAVTRELLGWEAQTGLVRGIAEQASWHAAARPRRRSGSTASERVGA